MSNTSIFHSAKIYGTLWKGIHAIAFAFKEVLDGWADETKELAMDSTWRTNAAQYELYAFVAEANGQAMSFAFLFTVSTGDSAEGAKTRMLGDVAKFMNKRCPKIMFTLSDKEPSEITACRTEIPKAKRQLWENKPPAPYDPRKAHKIFDFIDPTWAPGVTAVYADADEEREGVDEDEAQSEEPATQMPKPSQTCKPPVFVLKNGDVRIPVWPNPPKVTKGALPEFCPRELRSEIIEMYRTHMHQHPKIPQNNPDEPYVSAENIHRRAVKQMYDFCYSNGLSQVWAYLWNRWYTPKQWSLWARASCDAIPRLKTTMIVESLWRHVKHRDLAQFNRPRLDLVVNIVFKSLLPRVKRTLEYVRGLRRIGRPQALAGWQADAKAEWLEKSRTDEHRLVAKELKVLKSASNTKGRAERLQQLAEEASREAGTYATDTENWVCPCEYFFKSRFLMCKHLIREANTLLDNKPLTDLRFFLNLRRNHFPPYYSIPGIHALEQPEGEEDSQPKEVLVLGVRGAMAPTREERPEIPSAREPTPTDGYQDRPASASNGETAPREGRGAVGTNETLEDSPDEDGDNVEELSDGGGGDSRLRPPRFPNLPVFLRKLCQLLSLLRLQLFHASDLIIAKNKNEALTIFHDSSPAYIREQLTELAPRQALRTLERLHHVCLQVHLQLLLRHGVPPPVRLHGEAEARNGVVDALAVLDLGALAYAPASFADRGEDNEDVVPAGADGVNPVAQPSTRDTITIILLRARRADREPVVARDEERWGGDRRREEQAGVEVYAPNLNPN
ncbi:SWIM-type domain-containing protein [Mycena venus]|uniref:SWIM-type domain-containing protein n=1 Tax=Mycena venus TaxID=2733690 RepID=A0A8H6YJR5_9AGAR|nr:SWIM-type domain-containing protein [Mycena venus]